MTTTSTMKPEDDPSTPSISTKVMREKIQLTSLLMGGTMAMRAAGDSVLPRHDAERSDVYKERKNTAVLFNAFNKTVNTLGSKPFGTPINLSDDMPQYFDDIVQNADLRGNNLETVAQLSFTSGLQRGMECVLVDMPEGGNFESRADEIKAGMRPFLSIVNREDIVAGLSVMKDGNEQFMHLRLREYKTEVNGFAETLVQKIKQYDLVELEDGEVGVTSFYWSFDEDRKEWIPDSPPILMNGIKCIPLVIHYLKRTGFLESELPLENQAHLNMLHYQSASDQRMILTIARFPILAGKGISEEDMNGAEVVGPRESYFFEGQDSTLYYVEHSGAAIEAGRQDLEDLKTEMEAMGAELLVKRKGVMTATQKGIETQEEHSLLQKYATGHEAMMERVFYFIGLWQGEELEDVRGWYQVDKKFGFSDADNEKIKNLFQARAAGDIDHKHFLEEWRKLRGLSEEIDIDEIIQAVKAEKQEAIDLLGQEFANGDEPDDDEDDDDPSPPADD